MLTFRPLIRLRDERGGPLTVLTFTLELILELHREGCLPWYSHVDAQREFVPIGRGGVRQWPSDARLWLLRLSVVNLSSPSFGPALLGTTGRDGRSRPGARGDGDDVFYLLCGKAKRVLTMRLPRGVLQPVRARLAARAAAWNAGVDLRRRGGCLHRRRRLRALHLFRCALQCIFLRS